MSKVPCINLHVDSMHYSIFILYGVIVAAVWSCRMRYFDSFHQLQLSIELKGSLYSACLRAMYNMTVIWNQIPIAASQVLHHWAVQLSSDFISEKRRVVPNRGPLYYSLLSKKPLGQKSGIEQRLWFRLDSYWSHFSSQHLISIRFEHLLQSLIIYLW